MKKRNNIANINNISNNFILKSIFINLDYKTVLKLVKINKNLQIRLGINIENYKDKSDFPKYQYMKETKLIKMEELPGRGNECYGELFKICMISCITYIFFTYNIIYTTLLVRSDLFDNSNTKENYNKSYAEIINIINTSLFIFDAFNIGICFLLIFFMYDRCNKDYGIKKIIKLILMIIIDLVYILYEGLVIWKLVLSYKIKADGIPWFMAMDYVFLILNFIHIIYFLFSTYIFFKEIGSGIYYSIKYSLVSFNNIIIKTYKLPDDFGHMTIKERKKFILDNFKNYENILNDEFIIDDTKNPYRKKNNIPDLTYIENNRLPDFILNEPSIMKLYPDQNIYKLSNKEYILKYPINEFENKVINEDKSICDILRKDNLNIIQIIFQDNIKYIYIYDYSYKDYKLEINSSDYGNDIGYSYNDVPIPEINSKIEYYIE